jgi:hypothetical protein
MSQKLIQKLDESAHNRMKIVIPFICGSVTPNGIVAGAPLRGTLGMKTTCC